MDKFKAKKSSEDCFKLGSICCDSDRNRNWLTQSRKRKAPEWQGGLHSGV